MGKTGLRRITVSGKSFLWKTRHYHLEEFEESKCVDKVTIFLDGHKASPLILHFRLEDNTQLPHTPEERKWFMDSGCLIKNERVISLNRPAVIARFVEYYLDQGWTPHHGNKALEIESGLLLLESIELPEGRAG